MQHEVLLVRAFQRIDELLVLAGAQRGHHERLGFAAGEQRLPWARGRMPTSATIGRTVFRSRPSMRCPVSITELRMTSAFHFLEQFAEQCCRGILPSLFAGELLRGFGA